MSLHLLSKRLRLLSDLACSRKIQNPNRIFLQFILGVFEAIATGVEAASPTPRPFLLRVIAGPRCGAVLSLSGAVPRHSEPVPSKEWAVQEL